MIPIIIIQGATASGKSKLAIELAQALDSEIISADSRQVYRKLNIGTAKVSPEEQKQVKHHLIDIVDPDEKYSAGRFVDDASEKIFELHAAAKIPLIVGGTGMYVKALLEGLIDIPEADAEVKEKMKKLAAEKSGAELQQMLAQVDAESAERIETNDLQKLLRALEVWEITGKPISQHYQEQRKLNIFRPFRIFLDLDRKILYQRINQRIDEMIDSGLLKEIDNLLQAGYRENDPGLISVGYREFYPWFRGEQSLEESIRLAKKHSRNYAKRQLTWFRRIEYDLTLHPEKINICEIKQKILKWKDKKELK
ncbi:MAG: tRNA (adenosine(37)-N6)-dimethylallyltransferase MiaA [Candidatus Cloacimonadales bacterium]